MISEYAESLASGKREPGVSVIMPLYNKAPYVRRAIDSILSQSHQNFELIIVDDGSTDKSADAVREILDSRIRMLSQVNRGKCVARNVGISAAQFNLIAFLDADDEWMPDFLETVIDLYQRFPDASVWGTAYSEVSPDGKFRSMPIPAEILDQGEGLIVNFFTFSLQIQQPCNASSTMVRKEALDTVGGFPEKLARLGDTDTLFRLALRYPIAYCPIAKAVYHMEAANRSDCYLYSGNFLFFQHAKNWLSENTKNRLGDDVLKYLGHYHTRGLYRNWITGNKSAAREIIQDCSRIKGYRLTCLLWRLWILIPYPLVRYYLRLRGRVSRMLGRVGETAPVKSIFREHN